MKYFLNIALVAALGFGVLLATPSQAATDQSTYTDSSYEVAAEKAPGKVKKLRKSKRKVKKISLKWKKFEGADFYQVQVFKGKKKKAFRKVKAKKNKRTIKKLKPDTVYRFRVRAKVDGKFTKWSKKVKVRTKPKKVEESVEEEGQEETPQEEPASQTVSVAIENFDFNSDSITINAGDTVKWTNNDSTRHTVTSDSGSTMDSDLLSQGESYSVTFDTPGTYTYHCSPHPGMTGTVVVQ